MISSLAEAEARVVITTRRVRFSAFGLAWNRSLLFSSRWRSLWTYSASTLPVVRSPPIRLARCWATLTSPPPL